MRKVVYAMKTKLAYTLYPRIAAKCSAEKYSACVFLADNCVDGFCRQFPRRWSPNV